MKHHASADFWVCYRSLPREVQKVADHAFEHLKQDPQYPALHFKKVGRLWSARVGANHRAVAVEGANDLVRFWIGTRADYDRLLG
ncbi:MAG: hypothetical protein V1796_00035 [Pseudomonadota bacterium]